jgi:glycine cleavage system pyridoxal-binding protein P
VVVVVVVVTVVRFFLWTGGASCANAARIGAIAIVIAIAHRTANRVLVQTDILILTLVSPPVRLAAAF